MTAGGKARRLYTGYTGPLVDVCEVYPRGTTREDVEVQFANGRDPVSTETWLGGKQRATRYRREFEDIHAPGCIYPRIYPCIYPRIAASEHSADSEEFQRVGESDDRSLGNPARTRSEIYRLAPRVTRVSICFSCWDCVRVSRGCEQLDGRGFNRPIRG